jgi:hypothetical protein
MFHQIVRGGKGLFRLGFRRKKGAHNGTAMGYRYGAIGSYSGGDGTSVAWKALDYEYKELGNTRLLSDLATFLDVPPVSWTWVLKRFRDRYGSRKGFWLCKSKRDAEPWRSYGELESIRYNTANVVADRGHDGIYVLTGAVWSSSPVTEGEVVDDDQQVLEDADSSSSGGSYRTPLSRKKSAFRATGLGGMRGDND